MTDYRDPNDPFYRNAVDEAPQDKNNRGGIIAANETEREASPSAAIIDSQSIRPRRLAARAVMMPAEDQRAQRHALVDTDGRGLIIEPHPASIQDRDGGGPLLQASRRLFPFIERVFADGGYAGERVATATRIIVEIVTKSPDQIGFAVLPRRCAAITPHREARMSFRNRL